MLQNKLSLICAVAAFVGCRSKINDQKVQDNSPGAKVGSGSTSSGASTSLREAQPITEEIRKQAVTKPPGYELATNVVFSPVSRDEQMVAGVDAGTIDGGARDAAVPIGLNCGSINPSMESSCSYKESTGSCQGSEKRGSLNREFSLIPAIRVTGNLDAIGCGGKTSAEGSFWSECKFSAGETFAQVELETYVAVKRNGGCRDCEGSGARAAPRWSMLVTLPGNTGDEFLIQGIAAATTLQKDECSISISERSINGPADTIFPFVRLDYKHGPGQVTIVIQCKSPSIAQFGTPPNEGCSERIATKRPSYVVSVYKKA